VTAWKRYLEKLDVEFGRSRDLAATSEAIRVYRILVVATEWGISKGGVSTFNVNLCQGLAALGHEVLVVVPKDLMPGVSGTTLFKAEGLEVVEISERPSPADLNRIREHAADFVLGHDRFTGRTSPWLVDLVDQPAQKVLFIHTDPIIELYKHEPGGSRYRQREDRDHLHRLLFKSTDVVVPVGPRLAEHARAISRQLLPHERPKIVQFYPGIALRAEACQEVPTRPQDFEILLFGRMEDSELKGQDIALAAARRLLGEKSVGRIRFIGGSPDEVAEFWLSGEIGDHVDARPYMVDREQLWGYIRSSSVVLMPSREEGFGLVALEAIEANRPIIASGKSGFAQWLLDGLDTTPEERERWKQYLVVDYERPADEVDKLTEKLALVYENYSEVVDIIESLRERVRDYDWPASCDKLMRGLR